MDFSTSGSHSQRRGDHQRRNGNNRTDAEISSQRYERMIQQEIQQRNATRARRIQLLERALSQHSHVTNTVLRLLETEMQHDRATHYGSFNPYVDNAASSTLPTGRAANPYVRYMQPPTPLPHQPRQQQSQWTPLFQMATTSTATDGFSPLDIQRATQLVPYDNSMNETRCPITWANFTVGQNVLQINRCGHVFDPDALRTWFRQNRRCPICRIHPLPATAAASPAAGTAATTTTSRLVGDFVAPPTNSAAISRIVEEVAESLVHSISDVLEGSEATPPHATRTAAAAASTTPSAADAQNEGSAGPFNISSFEYTVDITDLLSALRGTRTP